MTDTNLNLFTYGTLQIPEVMQVITGKSIPSIDAVLNGYGNYSIRDEIYPAIIPQADASVSGRLYSGLDQSILRILDDFEDVIYNRLDCVVKTAGNALINAQVYVISDAYRFLLSDKPWSMEKFRNHNLEKYIERHKKFLNKYIERTISD